MVGRPSKYDDEVLSEYKAYLDQCAKSDQLPTIQGLALFLKVNRDTLYEWANVHPEFSDTLEELNNIQANQLIQRGLINEYNPTIAKLILSANHGMKERVDQTTNDKELPTPIYGSKSVQPE